MSDQPTRQQTADVLEERYELLERVGVGGMAEVWRARDRKLGREVAVKVFASSAARDSSRRARIAREARALASLHHPNVLAVYDYGESSSGSEDPVPFIVTELVDGPDLHRYVEEHGALEPPEAREILLAVLAAVERAHDAGVVHGDLKPANVLMSSHGPKVGDFGVARILGEETGTTTVAATPTFAAPEVLRGARPTRSSDVYSAACLAFQMLTGRPPYEGENAWDIATKHLEAPVPSVRRHRKNVPAALDEAVRRGLDKDPRRRHQSAKAFAEAIAEVQTVPITPPTAAAKSEPQPTEALAARPDMAAAAVLGPFAGLRDRFRRPGPRRAAIAILILLLALIGFVSFRGPPAKATVQVPDVSGQKIRAAAATLQRSGLRTGVVLFRVVDETRAGTVLETLPGKGATVEKGSRVRLIAGATLAPSPTVAPAKPEEPKGNGDRGRGKGKDGDD